MDLGEAIKRPFSDLKKFIIGALLNILPIVNFLSMGYALKAGEMSLKKNRSLPEWTDWGNLFVKGLLAFILSIIWMIPALILFLIGGGTALASVIANQGTAAIVSAIVGGGIFMILGMIWMLLVIYVGPSVWLNFVSKGNFGAGLEFGTILKKAFNAKYFVPWLLGLVVTIILTFIGSIIPVASIVLAPAASFASMVIILTLVGEVYSSL